MATVKQLREGLQKLPSYMDDVEVQCWLPGTYISLSASPGGSKDRVLIEGNIISTHGIDAYP